MRPVCRIPKVVPTRIYSAAVISPTRTSILARPRPTRIVIQPASFHHLSSTTRPVPQRSAIDPVTVLLAVTLSIGAGYLVKTLTSRSSLKEEPKVESEEATEVPTSPIDPLIPGMPSTIPPGRPSNLTAEQDLKLREFWLSTLEIFGVTHDHTEAVNGSTTPSTVNSDSPDTSGKKKKSRFSLLGKRHGKDSTASDAADEDDKYGQTKEFKHALANQAPEQLRDAFWSMVKHDDPDALLLRFLRARKWDVHAALIMLISTMHWRSQEMHVDDDIMSNGEGGALRDLKNGNAAQKKEGGDFLAQMKMGKSFLHGTDSEGRPICCVRARLHKAGEQTEKSLERYTVYTIETCRMLLRPPVDTATIVFDLTGFSMANMDYTPVKFMIKCFEANYPESLGSVLVYKAPWIFQGIWKIIKGWLDPVVASKVHFCSDVKELSEYIPNSRILKELGGDEAWDYTFVEPIEGEDAKMADTDTRSKFELQRQGMVDEYEKETLAWAKGDGKGDGRTKIAESLRDNYWKLDPYIRARSLYDRIGLIGQGGRLDFYPSKENVPPQGQANSTHANDLD